MVTGYADLNGSMALAILNRKNKFAFPLMHVDHSDPDPNNAEPITHADMWIKMPSSSISFSKSQLRKKLLAEPFKGLNGLKILRVRDLLGRTRHHPSF